jgi:hypothetical protein
VTNPQSLDLYNYVTDNPTTLNDPSGMCGCGGEGFGFGFSDTGEEGGGWGWGGINCGAGIGGIFVPGFGGFWGGPPVPPTIPIPGPVTASIVGGGLFSDPFSFASVEGSPPPWVPIVDDLPLPPSPTGTGKCTERSHLPGPIYGYPAGGDLCAGTDHPYFWWAWTCEGGPGSYGCCSDKAGVASKQCEKEGGVSGGLVNNYLETRITATFFYANCCSRKSKLKPPI